MVRDDLNVLVLRVSFLRPLCIHAILRSYNIFIIVVVVVAKILFLLPFYWHLFDNLLLWHCSFQLISYNQFNAVVNHQQKTMAFDTDATALQCEVNRAMEEAERASERAEGRE